MLSDDVRSAVFGLAERGCGHRAIARALRLSRNTVKEVLASGVRTAPLMSRPKRLDAHADTIRSLHAECRTNLVRVREELATRHQLAVPYATLTRFCRQLGLGVKLEPPAGTYTFAPGEEMQHDTSPHAVAIDGVTRQLQCAAVTMAYSRRVFAQLYPRFTRFECKVFLTAAVRHFGCAARRCMIDNTHVVILTGTGRDMVPVPEMASLAERLGFVFAAHAPRDPDRKARVERPFHYIEHNFYPGRTFATLEDANAQLVAWCDANMDRPRRELGGTVRALWPTDLAASAPLPLHVPDVFLVHRRQVCERGLVHLETNRYSAPWKTLHRWLDVREYTDKVVLHNGPEILATHPRLAPGAREKSLLPEHVHPGAHRRVTRAAPSPAELRLRDAAPVLAQMADLLRAKLPGRAVRALARLDALRLDYPERPFLDAVQDAVQYGLVDLEKLEKMILRRVAGEFFRLDTDVGPDEDT